jgi:beta-galactosidase
VTHIGCVPDRTFAHSIAAWSVATTLPADPWRLSGGAVTSVTAATSTGQRLHVLSNWGWEPQTVIVPAAACEMLADQRIAAGDRLELQAWDVSILLEPDER